MCSYHDRHTISLALDKEVEGVWSDNGEPLLQSRPLKASWAILLGRLSETQTTTFAVLEQPAVPQGDSCSKLVASPPHLETWEISDSPGSLLVDAAKESHREPLSGTQPSTGVVISWHDEPNGRALVSRSQCVLHTID
jgi:hypothetical protein